MTLQQEINNLTWHNAISKLKSILKKLLLNISNIQGFIPYTGTEQPITGIIETNSSFIVKGNTPNVTSTGGIGIGTNDDAIISFSNSNGGILNINFNEVSGESTINADENKGLGFDVDTSENIEDLDYTQKIFVTTNFGTLISLTTTEINALTPIEGKLYYNNTLKVVVFHNGTAWQKLSFTAM